MSKYSVGFYYQESGQVIVEANSQLEAEVIVEKQLMNDGVEFKFDCSDRDYGVTDSEATIDELSASLPKEGK